MSQTVVITGAAGTLGQAVIAKLAEDGFDLISMDLSDQRSEQVTTALTGVDLTDEAAMISAAARIRAETDSISGLVNVAGGFAWETLADGSIETWDRLYEVNVKSAVLTTKLMLPMLKKGSGAVVNIGAAGADKAAEGMGAYAASKAGVAKLTEALAAEEKGAVRVNALLPSIIDTPANRKDMPDADFDAWVTPQEVAEVISFLLSPKASGITGALIPVVGRV